GVVGPAEHLEAAVGLDQAHRARYLLVDRVGGVRDGGQAEEFGEDRLRYPVTSPGAPAARRSGQRGGRRRTPGPGTGPRIRPGITGITGITRVSGVGSGLRPRVARGIHP